MEPTNPTDPTQMPPSQDPVPGTDQPAPPMPPADPPAEDGGMGMPSGQ